MKDFLFFKSKNIKLYLFFLYFAIITILTIIWYNYIIIRFPHFIHENGNINYESLHFFFGGLTKNLIEKDEFYQNIYGINFYLSRMPLIPLFLKWSYLYISKKFLIILLVKNYLIFSILFYFLYKFLKKHALVFIVFLILFYNPYNTFMIIRLIPEEGILAILILSLYITLLQKEVNFKVLALLIVAIYFTKASQFLFCYIFSIIPILIFKNRLKYLPLLLIFISYITWTSFAYIKINKFITPFSITSISGLTLSVAYHEKFLQLYPNQSPDLLVNDIVKKKIDKINSFENEIEFNRSFKEDIFLKISNDKNFVLKSFLKKIHVLFLNVKYDAQNINSNKFEKIRYSEIPNKIVLFLSILIFLIAMIKKMLRKEDLYFITILSVYLIPYLIGFLYTRHLVPIYVLCHFYLFLKYIKLKNVYG
jgi:hypothetical protein